MRYELKIIRDVTKKECPWLEKDIKAGTEVYPYTGHTYGCITSKGAPVTFGPHQLPFFEVPIDALEK